MNITEFFSETKTHFKESPLRIKFSSNADILHPEFKEHLEKIDQDLKIIGENLNQPVKIVVMGEVKAGKSTFINAICGADISPMNVLEATAAITELHFSARESAQILMENGEEIVGSPSEIRDVLISNHKNQEFFENCKLVKIGTPLSGLCDVQVVDTPGLATVTEKNAQRSLSYVQNADVVLWVLNANQLGQTDVEDSIKEVAKLGKPVLAVINRIDEVQGDLTRLESYVKRTLGIYVKDIFLLSAYKAFKGKVEGNIDLIRESGFNELMGYIISNIERKADKVHLDSIKESIEALKRKDHKIHSEYLSHIEFTMDEIRKNTELINYYGNNILKKIEDDLNVWNGAELLNEEMEYLISIKSDDKLFNQKMEEFFSPQYLESVIYTKYNAVMDILIGDWDKSMSIIHDNIHKDFDIHLQKTQLIYADEQNSSKAEVKEGAKQGAVLGFSGATALAVYSAGIGPYAAAITFGTAFAAILPPVLIASVVVGLVAKFISGNHKKKNAEVLLRDNCEKVKKNIYNNVLPALFSKVETENNNIIAALKSSFTKSQYKNFTETDINELGIALRKYLGSK